MPNDYIGPDGFGTSNHVAATGTLPYRIDFENNPVASAPAHNVTLTDQLSPNFDWSSLNLTDLAFGDTHITQPQGQATLNYLPSALPTLSLTQAPRVSAPAKAQVKTPSQPVKGVANTNLRIR